MISFPGSAAFRCDEALSHRLQAEYCNLVTFRLKAVLRTFTRQPYMSHFRLDNKVAVVTGGASGIGKAISETFAANGAFVHILELNGEPAEATVKEIVEKGGKAQAHVCDVARQEE